MLSGIAVFTWRDSTSRRKPLHVYYRRHGDPDECHVCQHDPAYVVHHSWVNGRIRDEQARVGVEEFNCVTCFNVKWRNPPLDPDRRFTFLPIEEWSPKRYRYLGEEE